MAAYKDGTGRWRWRCMATNPHTRESKRLSGSSHPSINTKLDAEKQEETEVKHFQLAPAERAKLEQEPPLVKFVAIDWIAYMHKQPDKAKSYLNKQESNLVYHIIRDLGDRPMDKIDEDELEEYKLTLLNKHRMPRGRGVKRPEISRATLPEIAQLLPAPKKGPTLSSRLVIDVLSTLHKMFGYALRKRKVDRIPVFPDPPETEETQPVFLNFEEEKRLYQFARRDSDRVAMMFTIRTGLRAGEQMAIRWTDIDWVNKQVNVRRAYKLGGAIGPTKGKRQRSVDLDDALLNELKAHRHLKGELIFSRDDGAILTHGDLDQMITQAMHSSGIEKDITWHGLRHTFGSQAAMAGVPLARIRDWMGHASITTTEIYAHLCPTGGRVMLAETVKARGW